VQVVHIAIWLAFGFAGMLLLFAAQAEAAPEKFVTGQ
jgi:hypothetical protein